MINKKTDYDNELSHKLENYIKAGIVNVRSDTQYFIEEIEKHYPMGFSGIDWDKKKIISFTDISHADGKERQRKINFFLKSITKEFPLLLDAKIILLGDNLTTLSFEMRFIDFIELNDLFFSLPQHTYVWFSEVQKCINLTFEDELFFG